VRQDDETLTQNRATALSIGHDTAAGVIDVLDQVQTNLRYKTPSTKPSPPCYLSLPYALRYSHFCAAVAIGRITGLARPSVYHARVPNSKTKSRRKTRAATADIHIFFFYEAVFANPCTGRCMPTSVLDNNHIKFCRRGRIVTVVCRTLMLDHPGDVSEAKGLCGHA